MRYFHFAGLLIAYGICSTSAHAETPIARDWSGFYLGGSVGVAKSFGDTKASTSLGAGSYFISPDDVQLAAAGDGSLSQSRLSGGMFAGFGRQYGNVVIGVETSVNSLGFDDSRTQTTSYISAPGTQFSLRQTVEADWQGTLRLRLGYTQENWLAYVTGGAALTRVKLATSFSDNFQLGASGQGSESETKAGWTLGAGGEYALFGDWTIRGEYLYANFGSIDNSSVVTNPSNPGLGNTIRDSIDFRTHTLSIGLVYRFP
ncbi:MAG: outer membrane protein [Methylophilaceae bacterium]